MEKLIYNPFSLVIAVFLVIIGVISLQKNARELRQSSTILVQTQQEIEKLNGEIIELQTQYKEAQTDFKKEQIIRNELLLKRPGEYIVLLPELEVNSAITKSNQPNPHWKEWYRLIF